MTVRRYESAPAQPGDRGRDFGAVHANQVRRTVATYHALMVDPSGTPLDLREWGDRAFDVMSRLAPDLAEEIDGIASGAGLPRHEVAAINARTELLALGQSADHGECSVAVALRPCGQPVAMQTWDWFDGLAENWLLWTIRHSDGRVVRTVTEHGIVGKIGSNDSGLGLLFNILHHDEDGSGPLGFPVHVLARQILDRSTDINEALVHATRAVVSASTSMTLVGDGSAVSVELSPAGPGVVLPDVDGVLVHTNHFLADSGRPGCREVTVGPDTFIRLDMLRRGLRRYGPEPTDDDVLAAMTDHTGGAGAVCCHPDPALAPGRRYTTLATINLHLAANAVDVISGGPCGHTTDKEALQ